MNRPSPAYRSALRLAPALNAVGEPPPVEGEPSPVEGEPSAAEPPAASTLELVAAPVTDPRIDIAHVARTIAEIRALVKARRRAGAVIGLVPTMGALHEGHLSLIREAHSRCDLVVVSIFVNPTQFNEQSDLLAYPRQEERDVRLASEAGAHVVFAPEPDEIYKPGFSTHVEVEGLTDRLEGAVRGSGHFRGVTTVVCKLLNIVAPELAFFGQKDAQQAAVIRRMCVDLDVDVTIETLPIVRERDGLAMSSRNVRLDAAERARSLALVSTLRAAEALARQGERSAQRLIAACQGELERWSVEPEYVALVEPQSFEDVVTLQDDALLLVAARLGHTRLIDNALLRRSESAQSDGADDRRQGAESEGAPRAEAAGDARAKQRNHRDHRPEAEEAATACSA